jgi:hypothetical protein
VLCVWLGAIVEESESRIEKLEGDDEEVVVKRGE